MKKIPLQSLFLLVISEYGNLDTAFNAESMLVELLNKMDEIEIDEYQEYATQLEEFNNQYMSYLIKKQFSK